LARKSTIKKIKKNKEKTSVKYIALPASLPSGLKNVGPIRDCEPPHAHSAGVATGTVARRLRIDVHDANDDNDDNDNA